MKIILLLIFTSFSINCFAQHQHEHAPAKKDTIPPKNDMGGMNMQQDTVPHKNMDQMQGMEMGGMDMMIHAYSKNLPMSRNGSGTSWMPDASPMYMYMKMKDRSMFMLHGNIFLRYTKQDLFNKGSRGDDHFDAPDWFMAMYNKLIGKKGLLNATAMLSFDPFLVGKGGYPLLFQSGESYNGKKLVDRQHPHDLFSGLTLGYTQMINRDADVFLYFGYPGEPALGPPAFMHRISTMNNPDAPLTHHWQDATHITFGVGTLGFRYKDFKLEGSLFTGREPNENRYDFDKMRFDSYSYRLSYNPSKNWALQISHAYINSPEALHPEENIHRTTASAEYSLPLTNDNWFNATAVWGLNKQTGEDGENAALLEASYRINKLTLFGRYEYVQKSTEELNLDEAFYGNTLFPVNLYTLGVNYDLLNVSKTRIAVGSQFTLYDEDKKLYSLYGKNPTAFEVYLRIYPGLMKM